VAGWNPLRFREWFDEDFPDWFDFDTPETAEEGQRRRAACLNLGRRDVEKNLEWVELWSLDDILLIFGFQDDEERAIKTTYIRGFKDD